MNSKYKILFLGKESNGWQDGVFDIHSLMDFYKYKAHYQSLFWHYVYGVNNLLNPGSGLSFTNFYWSNVSKWSDLNGKSIDESAFYKLITKFNVLEKEINIIAPDIVFFFSEWGYDDMLMRNFLTKR